MNAAYQLAALVLLHASGFAGLQNQAVERPPLRFKVGDKLRIDTPLELYGGDYVVSTDGAIYGRGFNRLIVANRTYDQVLAALRKSFSGLIAPDRVSLTLVLQRPEYVFVLGGGKLDGQVEFTPGLTLRQMVSAGNVTDKPETIDVQLFRAGKSIRRANLYRLLADSSEADTAIAPNDVVSFVPQAALQVWVTGLVNRPGRIQLPVGSNVYEAVAAAGGLLGVTGEDRAREDETTLVIQRGAERIEIPARQFGGAPEVLPGDSVTVLGPETRRISVFGEVAKPGEFLAKGPTSILGVVAQAGGLSADGTLKRVVIIRGQEIFQIDASGPTGGESPPMFALKGGDVVFVRRNENVFYVLGQVSRPGKFPMLDRQVYTAADALAAAGGLDARGVLRRVYIARPDASGKVVVQKFNLDEYLKNGKVESNPVIQPGDAVLFSSTDNLSFAALAGQLGNLLVIDSLLRTR